MSRGNSPEIRRNILCCEKPSQERKLAVWLMCAFKPLSLMPSDLPMCKLVGKSNSFLMILIFTIVEEVLKISSL